MSSFSPKDAAATLACSATLAAIAKQPLTHYVGPNRLAVQVGSAVGSAAGNGAGLGGALAAGGGVIAAKVATVAAVGAAAAPILIVAGVGYALFKLFDDR